MADRPIWRGLLKLSLVTCPIRLYSALTERGNIHFNLLNPETGSRIRMQPVDASTGEEVERADLVKGYQYAKGKYVVVSEEELAELKIESSDTMVVERFAPAADIEPIYYENAYYVVPDGDAGIEAYGVIRDAMREAKKVALCRVVIARRERVVALAPHGKGMMGHSLRSADEVVKESAYFKELGSTKADREMVTIATKLIEQKAGAFEPSAFEDRYEERVRELLDAKLKGEKLEPEELPEPRSNVVDLMAALKESLGSRGQKDRQSGGEGAKIHRFPGKKARGQRKATRAAAARRHTPKQHGAPRRRRRG
jgi:DNA end-binding protein Ku